MSLKPVWLKMRDSAWYETAARKLDLWGLNLRLRDRRQLPENSTSGARISDSVIWDGCPKTRPLGPETQTLWQETAAQNLDLWGRKLRFRDMRQLSETLSHGGPKLRLHGMRQLSETLSHGGPKLRLHGIRKLPKKLDLWGLKLRLCGTRQLSEILGHGGPKPSWDHICDVSDSECIGIYQIVLWLSVDIVSMLQWCNSIGVGRWDVHSKRFYFYNTDTNTDSLLPNNRPLEA
jgi:hypothetical protein